MLGSKKWIWSAEDDRKLLEMHAAGKSSTMISASLRRSIKALRQRLWILRAGDRSGPKASTEA
jgi:hypothetical protein